MPEEQKKESETIEKPKEVQPLASAQAQQATPQPTGQQTPQQLPSQAAQHVEQKTSQPQQTNVEAQAQQPIQGVQQAIPNTPTVPATAPQAKSTEQKPQQVQQATPPTAPASTTSAKQPSQAIQQKPATAPVAPAAQKDDVFKGSEIITVVDKVVNKMLAAPKGRLPFSDIQREFNVSPEMVRWWADCLEDQGLASIEQPSNPMQSLELLAKHVPVPEQSDSKKKAQAQELSKYEMNYRRVPLWVEILRLKKEYIPLYVLKKPAIGPGTLAVLEAIKSDLARSPEFRVEQLTDPRKYTEIVEQFTKKTERLISEVIPGTSKAETGVLADVAVAGMLGLGDVDLLLADDGIEDLVVNNSLEPVSIYYRKLGWLKTNLQIEDEDLVWNMSEGIARHAGRQITALEPLLDAHLLTGDRVNATLWPISSKGNTITIRRFARKPWNIVDLIGGNTLDSNMAAFLWLAVQYEANILVIGGTGSGKTSFLNAILPFIQPNHRILTIEDTRELQIPNFAHWVPLVTRPPNPEGKGNVDMLNLMINALRMRPDRIIVGEVRKHEHAEVLFEAIHTGHPIIGTFHADTASGGLRRLIEPPMDIPPIELEALHLFITQFRNRRTGVRRTTQIAEILPSSEELKVALNLTFRWEPRTDGFMPVNESVKIFEEVSATSGMNTRELMNDLQEKKRILDWLCKNKYSDVNGLGLVMANYYVNKDIVLKAMTSNLHPSTVGQ